MSHDKSLDFNLITVQFILDVPIDSEKASDGENTTTFTTYIKTLFLSLNQNIHGNTVTSLMSSTKIFTHAT